MADDSECVAAFTQGLSKLLKNGEFADLTIVCGTYTHNVHKNILRAHSDYFAALPNFAEGKTNTIHFKAIGDDDDDEACDDPEAIKLMIHYFYHLDYTATISSETSLSATSEVDSASKVAPTPKGEEAQQAPSGPPATGTLAAVPDDGDMVMHAKVFAAAVKYQVATLRNLAADKFTKAVKVNWRHDSFAKAARIVYSTTPGEDRTLRDVVTLALDWHDDTLLERDGLVQVVKDNKEIMFDLLCKSRRIGSFKWEMSISSSTSSTSEPSGDCPDCGGSVTRGAWGEGYCTYCEMEC